MKLCEFDAFPRPGTTVGPRGDRPKSVRLSSNARNSHATHDIGLQNCFGIFKIGRDIAGLRDRNKGWAGALARKFRLPVGGSIKPKLGKKALTSGVDPSDGRRQGKGIGFLF
jgi:hypothetical protein